MRQLILAITSPNSDSALQGIFTLMAFFGACGILASLQPHLSTFRAVVYIISVLGLLSTILLLFIWRFPELTRYLPKL
jgi:hypothetical protein